jgi:Ca-activated chloride channel family protein
MLSLLDHWPEWSRLYWLLAAPLAVYLLWALYHSRQHSKDWHAILPVAFHAILLKQHTPNKGKWTILALALAWLCALLALLGPSWLTLEETPTKKLQQPALVIAIQLTPDVLANDLAPSRLHQIRQKVISLLESRDDAATALVVYAGSAHTLVPLSNDLLTSTNLLQAMHPDLMPVSGQRADLAVQRAIELLQQGAQGRGQILLISNGVTVNEQLTIEQILKKKPAQLHLLGVGTAVGAPMAISAQGDFLTDAAGAIMISRLNATSLQLLSKQTASPYATLSSDAKDLQQLGLLDSPSSVQQTSLATNSSTQQDQGYWFILPLLLLAASFARRGSAFIIIAALLPMLPTPTYAFEFDDLWLRPDQQGQKLLEQQQPALAAQRFNDPAWRASALYLAKDYQRAAENFALLDSAEAHYNRGNALALAGNLTEALEAYQQALEDAPEMLAAQYNYDVVAEILQRSKAAQPADTSNSENDSEAVSGSPSDNLSDSNSPASADVETPSNGNKISEQTASALPPTQINSTPSSQASDTSLASSAEQPSAPTVDLESWLEQIPDDPSELLKRKFWYEQQRQETQQ